MYLSFDWLSDYIEFPKQWDASSLRTTITTSIAEVEQVETIGQQGIVIGKIVSITPHPQADKLRLATVSTGDKQYHVVCGGTNLIENMLVPIALIGSKVKWHGEGDWITLEKATIRGVESEGMICASNEIGLSIPCGDKEITDLSTYVKETDIGKNVYDVLGINDMIIEIENKSLTNRPDLFGHYGFARDLYTVLKNQSNVAVTLKPYPFTNLPQLSESLNVTIQSNLCRRYSAIRVSNVTIQESPQWLQNRLLKVGIRPINNVVDVTNYVMYDIGEPLHAFDASCLEKASIVIRQAISGESIVALDGKTYQLTPDDTIIADSKKPVAIAGIMGGEFFSITPKTTEVVFEAANFNPVSLRKTSQRLGLRSESSTRFEKNLDPEYTILALNRAVTLLQEICKEVTISSALFDVYPEPLPTRTIIFDPERANKKIGVSLSIETISSILQDLGCTITSNEKNTLSIKIPTWRATKDITLEDDLIEEIARIYGYHKIPLIAPEGILYPSMNQKKLFESRLRHIFSDRLNFTEVYNYPFTNITEQEKFSYYPATLLALKNPIASHQTHMKTTLIPHLLHNSKENIHTISAFSLFELGRTFCDSDTDICEKKKISGIVVLPKKDQPKYEHLFFLVKENLEILFSLLHLPPRTYTPHSVPFTEKGNSASISIQNTPIGIIGALHQSYHKDYDLERSTVVLFELDVEALFQIPREKTIYTPLPKYPVVVRDFCFLVPSNIPTQDIAHCIQHAHPLISDVTLFDIFESEQIGKNTKSLSFQVTYVSKEKTLQDSEIETISQLIIKQVKTLGGNLRSI